MEGQLVAALRKLGFDYVFDTQFAADLTIMEEASEFLERVQGKRQAADDHLLLQRVDEVHGAVLPGPDRERLDLQVADVDGSAR